jgi:hypothetical protein
MDAELDIHPITATYLFNIQKLTLKRNKHNIFKILHPINRVHTKQTIQ